jgi:hypothetical protein
MNKHIFVPDIHGESLWKEIVKNEEDTYVFLGDYFDSFHISIEDQLKNFEDLLEFKEKNKEKCKFLLGNHDIHYLLAEDFLGECIRGSGFDMYNAYKILSLFNNVKDDFQLAYQINNILCTHAGLTQDHYDIDLKEIHENYPEFNYGDLLNHLWKNKSEKLMRVGHWRGGRHPYGGVFWCDRRELMKDPLKGITQIVGHTPTKKVEIHETEDNNKLVFTDCIIYNKEKLDYYEIEI